MATLDLLRLLAHNVLTYTTSEMRQFRVFSTWLQQLIHLSAAEPGSVTAQEAAEKIADTEYATLLSYITGALIKSRLALFMERETTVVLEALQRSSTTASHDDVVMLLDQHRDGSLTAGTFDIHAVDLLFQALTIRDKWSAVCKDIPRGFAALTQVEKGLVLETEPMSGLQAMRMIDEVRDHSSAPLCSCSSMAKLMDLGTRTEYFLDNLCIGGA